MFLEIVLRICNTAFHRTEKEPFKEYFPQGGRGQGMPLRKEYSPVFRFNLYENTNIDPQGMWYL